MDVDGLLSEIFETIFFHMTRRSLPYIYSKIIFVCSFSAMMYSDFHYRPPPPSYQASMQEYRLRLLLLDRQSGSHSGTTGGPPGPGPGLAIEPPPNYRAHLR